MFKVIGPLLRFNDLVIGVELDGVPKHFFEDNSHGSLVRGPDNL